MSNASGLRGLLLAGALVVLAHGLLMKRIYQESRFVGAGRPHDGMPHPSLFEQTIQNKNVRTRTKDDEIREMFEFAQAPSDMRRCANLVDDIDVGLKNPEGCATSSATMPRASYVNAGFVNNYPDENIMNVGIEDGIGAFESLGFGGSEL